MKMQIYKKNIAMTNCNHLLKAIEKQDSDESFTNIYVA